MARTGFYLHSASSLHDTGWGHPEHQGRLRALASSVGKDLLALHGHVDQFEPDDATLDDLLAVHTSEHVERVRAAADRAAAEETLIHLDPDTIVSPASWDAAIGSAGAVCTALEAIRTGELDRAFVATRPPGHHATPDRAMGFCLFNHVAVAARWAQRAGLAERVWIIDWDVHHGNGTQDIFYEDDSVFYLSLHQWPHWPGTGAASEEGSGPGSGYTLNVPVPAGLPAPEYRATFTAALEEVTSRFEPELVLISAGFDALAGDPLGGLLLEPEDFHAMTSEVIEHTRRSAHGRVVAALEGGYDPKRTGTGAVAVIRALAGVPFPDPDGS